MDEAAKNETRFIGSAEDAYGESMSLAWDKQYKMAIFMAEQGLALKPANPSDFYKHIGLCWMMQQTTLAHDDEKGSGECYAKAARAFEKALTLQPDDRSMLVEIGTCYEKLEDYKGHTEIFRGAAEVAEKKQMRAIFYYALGQAIEAEAKTRYGRSGDYAKIEIAYKSALDNQPTNYYALELAEFYYRNRLHLDVMKDMEDSLSKARRYAEEVLKRASDEPKFIPLATQLIAKCDAELEKYDSRMAGFLAGLRDEKPEPKT